MLPPTLPVPLSALGFAPLVVGMVARADDQPPADRGPTPSVAVHLTGMVSRDEEASLTGLGGGAEVGLRLWGPLWAEVEADVVGRPGSPVRVGVAPALRVYATDRFSAPAVVSFAVGAGVDLLPGRVPVARPLVRVGAALDLQVAPSTWLRVGAGYATHTLPVGGAELTLGIAWTPAPRKAEPPAPEPPPPTGPVGGAVDPLSGVRLGR